MASTKASTLPDVISYKTESKIKFQKSQQVSSPAFHFRVEKKRVQSALLAGLPGAGCAKGAGAVLVVCRVLVWCWTVSQGTAAVLRWCWLCAGWCWLCTGCWGGGAGLFHRVLVWCWVCTMCCWCGAGVVLGWCWVSTGHHVTFESRKATERNGPAAAGPGPALGHFRIMVCSDSEVPSRRSLTDSSQVSGWGKTIFSRVKHNALKLHMEWTDLEQWLLWMVPEFGNIYYNFH